MIQTFDFPVADGTVRIERDYTEINTSMPVADEKWRVTDSNGHEHYYGAEKTDAERAAHYPTLIYVPGPSTYCPDCGDEHEDYAVSHFECRMCSETVTPGSREPVNPVAHVLNRQAAYLNGELISKERAERLLSEALTAEKNDGNLHEVSLG